MQARNAGLILIVLALLAGAFIWYGRQHPPVAEVVQQQFDWSFVDRGVDPAAHTPLTYVSLRIAGVDVALGTFTGTCFEIDGSSWKLLPGEVSGAMCWWGGAGTELGVFTEGGNLVLKQGEAEEGTAGEPGFRGNFKPLVKQADTQ